MTFWELLKIPSDLFPVLLLLLLSLCLSPDYTPSFPEGERPDVLSPGCPFCVGEEAEGGATGLSERPYSQGRKERGWRRDGLESARFF